MPGKIRGTAAGKREGGDRIKPSREWGSNQFAQGPDNVSSSKDYGNSRSYLIARGPS